MGLLGLIGIYLLIGIGGLSWVYVWWGFSGV